LFSPQASLDPDLTGMTGTSHHAQFFPLRWDLTNFSLLC
jgi:hypothetical protein